MGGGTVNGTRTRRVKNRDRTHHEGWMISGQKTVFCWVPANWVTRVISLGKFYLPTNSPGMGCY
jgi:hypothetical protein